MNTVICYLNACKDIGLSVNTGQINYWEVGRRHGMMANESQNR